MNHSYRLDLLAYLPRNEKEAFVAFNKWFNELTKLSVTEHKTTNVKFDDIIFLFGNEIADSMRFGVLFVL